MANSLLDFVMALVRDPVAAAHYQADPAQAIADAHLVGVSSADVDNLIPVVSESVSTAMPGGRFDTGLDSNVWSSGAATEAFDAFAAPVIDEAGDNQYAIVTDMGAEPLSIMSGAIGTAEGVDAPSLVADDLSLQVPALDVAELPLDPPIESAHQSGIWESDGVDAQIPSGFDIFE
ncbi:MAG: Rv0340 family IniB-related protein [Mycobacterium sp.]